MPFGKFSKLVLIFGLNGNATFEQRNKKSGKISPAAKRIQPLFHTEHLFLFIPHQGHCLLELLDAYILF